MALIGIFGTIIGSIITVISNKKIAKYQNLNEFRLAALEKGLQVHQEAYTLWSQLFLVCILKKLMKIHINVKNGDIRIVYI